MNAPTRNCVLTLAAILAALASAPVAAQVWRCGTTYSEQPCEGGRAMDVQDGRSTAQQSEAARAAQRDARLATGMERDRLQHEAKLDKAWRSANKAKPARGKARPDDDPEAWDFDPPSEPFVARAPKAAATTAKARKETTPANRPAGLR